MNFAKRVYKLQSTRSVCSQSRSFRSLIRPQRVFIQRRMFADAAQAVDTDNTNGDNANTNETKNEQSEEEIAKAKKMALDRRSRQFGFANYEEFQDDLNHMRQMEQAKAAKYSTGRMSAKARQLMWYLHTEDPEVHTVESLAGAFGLHRERCRALLVLEGIMHVDHAEGHYVGNPHVLDKAAAKAGFYVAHTRIDQPEDYAETQRFHHGKKALIDGEIDEVAFQRLMEQKPLHIIARERHLKNKFPKEPPAATPEYLKHVHVVSKGKRRTLKGRTKWIVAQTKKIHDVTEQIKIPIQIHEKDGTVRTASWEEREEIFNIDKRKPRGNEMTPLEQVRKYAGTPWHYRGTLYNNKKWKAYLEEVKEGKHRVEGDFYEYNDPDLVEAGDETNDSSFDLDTKTTKKSLRNESEEETIVEDNDILPGIEAEEDEEELENDDENTK